MAPDDWIKVQTELVAGEEWILDGDLGPHDVLQPRLERADTVVAREAHLLAAVERHAPEARLVTVANDGEAERLLSEFS